MNSGEVRTARRIVVDAQPFDYAFELSRTALVIIDMQRDFIEPGGFGASLGNDVSLLSAIVPACRNVLNAWRARGGLVLHTREAHRPDLRDCPPSKRSRGNPSLRIGDVGPMGRVLVTGEPGVQIIPELSPLPGEIVVDKPGKGHVLRPRRAEPAAAGRHHQPSVHGRHHGGLRADQHARGQRPRLRQPAAGRLHRELLSAVQGGGHGDDPRAGRDRRLDRAECCLAGRSAFGSKVGFFSVACSFRAQYRLPRNHRPQNRRHSVPAPTRCMRN